MRSILRFARHWLRYWLLPVLPLGEVFRTPQLYYKYLKSWIDYEGLPGSEKLSFLSSYPRLGEDVSTTGFDAHYLYQAVWAMERISRTAHTCHVDIGSDIKYVSMLTTHLPVYFVDIRPLEANLSKLYSVAASVLELPFKSLSLSSVSCLHVIEHIGLGRYGDPLDALGTTKACTELARVVAPNGDLFVSTPVGKSRVCFNAHRIHTPRQIASFFADLELIEFSAVTDEGQLVINANMDEIASAGYACGLFWFRRRSK